MSVLDQQRHAFKAVIQLIKQHGGMFGGFDLVKGNNLVGHIKALVMAVEQTTNEAFYDRAGGGRVETCHEAGGFIPPKGLVFTALPP